MTDKTLLQRINAVMQEVTYVRKDTNVQGRYSAVSHDMVTAVLHGPMAEHGIAFIVNQRKCDTEALKDGKDKTFWRTTAKVAVSFINVDNAEDRITVRGYGIGDDYGDKGPGKALSYAVKNVMLKTFMLETGENDESRMVPEPSKDPIPEDVAVALQKKAIEAGVDAGAFFAWFNGRYKSTFKTFADVTENVLPEFETALAVSCKKAEKAKAETGND